MALPKKLGSLKDKIEAGALGASVQAKAEKVVSVEKKTKAKKK